MVDTINVSDFGVAGRAKVPDPNIGQISVSKNINFSEEASYSLDFTTLNQVQQIGVIRTLFLDNSSNPSEIEVQIGGTDQFFTVPAYAEGYFPVTARVGSIIVLYSEGGATDTVTAIFYNYDISPAVWYKYGAVNKDIAQKVQGAFPDGTNASGEFSNGVMLAGVTPDGKVKRVAVDANGNLVVSNLDITIGAIYGPDAIGGAPSHPGVLTAGLNTDGNVTNLTTTADGKLRVTMPDPVTPPNGSAVTTVVASAASVALKAANPARRGILIFNNSASPLKVSLGDNDAATTFSLIIDPASTFALNNGDYTGKITGAWLSADGDARVTEIY